MHEKSYNNDYEDLVLKKNMKIYVLIRLMSISFQCVFDPKNT
jgi:hypothetical protein